MNRCYAVVSRWVFLVFNNHADLMKKVWVKFYSSKKAKYASEYCITWNVCGILSLLIWQSGQVCGTKVYWFKLTKLTFRPTNDQKINIKSYVAKFMLCSCLQWNDKGAEKPAFPLNVAANISLRCLPSYKNCKHYLIMLLWMKLLLSVWRPRDHQMLSMNASQRPGILWILRTWASGWQ